MISLILWSIFVIPILISLLTYILFCYEEANSTDQPLTSLMKLAVRAALKSILREILILISFPLGLWPNLWNRPQTGHCPIVVLVHGLFHNPSAWTVFRFWLQGQGLASVCFTYPSWGPQDFDQTVTKIRDRLQHVIQEYPTREIHLLGHSLGGLLLRAALAKPLPGPPSIKSLITLGTPFQGSKLAPFALNSLGRYIWYKSPAITATAKLSFPDNVQGHALWSAADNMVLPNNALECGIVGWKSHETPAISHVAMLYSPKIFRQILKIIQGASTTNMS